ncbi:MAG: hypothetical protein HOM63_01265 [Kordiimonadaceae bacterium]|nr:hypothetical protein [Kordiimonadaceae bacterium]
MILRRFMKHVTDENWFVVGLEMVVVVLGIIIGLQFSNWNEQRLELVKGQSYLNRIADELEQDIRFFNGVLRSNERSIENAQFLLETAENEDLVREDPTRFITSIASVGNVSDKAKALFEEAAKTEPTNPRVEYNIALYEIQHGQAQEAFDRLNSLLNGAPTNAPWISQIKQRMEVAAGQLNNATTSRPMKQPSQEQIMEVSSMSAGDQDAFIRSMVDGLAEDLKENPDNLNGWLNLARSYGVLKEWQKSADAYQEAIRLSPEDEKIKGLYKSAFEKVVDN